MYFSSVPAFFFQDLGSSLLSLLWIIFQEDCLSPLHLVFLLEFYLVLSSGKYFSAVSFCVTFCVCSLCSSGNKIIVPLAFGVCRLVGEVGPGLCRLPGQRDWCLPTGGWSWVLSLWWAGLYQGVCLEVAVGSGGLQTACLLMGGAVFLPCWLFGLKHPSPEHCRPCLGANVPSKGPCVCLQQEFT